MAVRSGLVCSWLCIQTATCGCGCRNGYCYCGNLVGCTLHRNLNLFELEVTPVTIETGIHFRTHKTKQFSQSTSFFNSSSSWNVTWTNIYIFIYILHVEFELQIKKFIHLMPWLARQENRFWWFLKENLLPLSKKIILWGVWENDDLSYLPCRGRRESLKGNPTKRGRSIINWSLKWLIPNASSYQLLFDNLFQRWNISKYFYRSRERHGENQKDSKIPYLVITIKVGFPEPPIFRKVRH